MKVFYLHESVGFTFVSIIVYKKKNKKSIILRYLKYSIKDSQYDRIVKQTKKKVTELKNYKKSVKAILKRCVLRSLLKTYINNFHRYILNLFLCFTNI